MHCLSMRAELLGALDRSQNVLVCRKKAQEYRAPSWDPPWAQELFLFPPVVSATKEKGCNISLCRCSPHQIMNLFVPFSSVLIYQLSLVCCPSKGKAQNKQFRQSLFSTFCSSCFGIWSEWISRKSKAAAPVSCEWATLATSAFLFMQHGNPHGLEIKL